MMYLRNRDHRAVSLAEILIIVLVVAVAIIPLYTLMTENARQVSFNADRAMALIMAQQIIERYRHERYDFVKAAFAGRAAGKATIDSDDILNELFMNLPDNMQSFYFKFTREAEFVEIAPNLEGMLTVYVNWTNNQRKQRGIRIMTVMRNPDYHAGQP